MVVRYSFEIQSIPENLNKVHELIEKFGEENSLNEDKLHEVQLCVSEATTNAIFHANKLNPDKTVTITLTLSSDELTIVIKDQGPGFDPAKIPNPTNPENLLKDSGRGLYLMQIYSKSLEYVNTGSGTETILVFAI